MKKKEIKNSLTGFPKRHGMYNPDHEKDACGFGFIANLDNIPKHEIIHQALEIVHNLDHRGAVSADPLAGDGAGILIQIPDEFFRIELAKRNYFLPELSNYGIGMIFFPNSKSKINQIKNIIKQIVLKEGLELICWRDVPVNSSVLGVSVRANEPKIKQLFIKKGNKISTENELERKLYIVRKLITSELKKNNINDEDFYIPSLSTRTIVYKGMVLAPNLSKYYLDFQSKYFKSAMAMFHQRFSTNTFPSWQLAQPFRYLCHNGEINTVQGNKNWINSRKHTLTSKLLGKDISKIWPVIEKNPSDSSAFDNALELLLMGGYSLPHAMMLMIPEAWNNNKIIKKGRKSFYEFFAGIMEPWDGPAAMAFSDGKKIAATLDRNGLRPARYIVTKDNTILMASEVGVLPSIEEENIKIKWRLQPGKMLLVDLEEKRIISDNELKDNLSSEYPYQTWVKHDRIKLSDLKSKAKVNINLKNLLKLQKCFGYSKEDIKFFLQPMMIDGQDPVGSMGRDIPLATLSDKSRLLYDYFFQKFAQVTNPPIDPIREEVVMSLKTYLGSKPNIFDFNNLNRNKLIEIEYPILSNHELNDLKCINRNTDFGFKSQVVDITFDTNISLAKAINNICFEAKNAVRNKNINILIVSDRGVNESKYAVPTLIAISAIHHFLIQKGLRNMVSIVAETGEARKVHDICLLSGYGAEAINPYLGFATISDIIKENNVDISEKSAHLHYIKSICKGMLKVMSKMGISTFQSYCGAQIFDAVGLSDKVIKKYFTGTSNKVEGITIKEIEREVKERHSKAYHKNHNFNTELDVGGDLAFRVNGEEHVWKPETITLLQHSVRSDNYELFKKYTSSIDDQTKKLKNLRGLFNFKKVKKSINIHEVEPVGQIVKRFATGAMSLGSISTEAHSTLAIAMNRLGGRSNTGEGGEDPIRFKKLYNGDSLRSKIKQVASGRFGVTTEYLSNADDIQIKMAQGAKPGEGGQLPGHKVDEYIASIRHSTPGVGLISPPPHHDIYSIEDLAQLIFDLKNVNQRARISVKLVSEFGVGTVAAGVSKAFADHVTISGHDGGTGASPLTSVLSAGGPWELGLAETHQTLLLNDLRGRIAVQVDGGLRTGRDVVVGALLGADEFGFATSALVAEGCIMMRKCHLNTCPVGVATQDPELRKHFSGKPEHIVNFFTFLASEVREIMADLGFKTFNDMIGRRDYLDFNEANQHWKANNLDLSNLISQIDFNGKNSSYNSEKQKHKICNVLDKKIISNTKSSIEKGEKTNLKLKILNTDRSVGAMLSGIIAKKYGHNGLPKNTINIAFKGSAGQSFGSWLSHGISFSLEGDANDYVGKGLSGGSISIYPSLRSSLLASKNIIVGNTVLYGAISGECFINGIAGERFAVRNSGATSVVEGCGDHGCEYMTGGSVVILGSTGRNFAAGMSGGIAYIYDKDKSFRKNCNLEMVSLEKVKVNSGNQKVSFRQLKYEMLDFDELRLKNLIKKHIKYTNSYIGRSIIKNWSSSLEKFIKVVPNDFKKVLEDQQKNNRRKKVLKKVSGF